MEDELAALRERVRILEDLIEDPMLHDSEHGVDFCKFCDHTEGYDHVDHEPDCLWLALWPKVIA